MENLREIDEYPGYAGAHALAQSTHTLLLIFVGVSLPLLSALLCSPSILLPSCCFHVFPFSVVTNPVPQGKNIPHSKGRKAPLQSPAQTCKHNHAKHTYTNRQTDETGTLPV